MIHESWPWRVHLIKDADIIERWCQKSAITEQRSFIIERKVFLAAYSVRKLFQARKLSSAFTGKTIKCKTFPAFDKHAVTAWNAYKIEKLYDLSRPENQEIKARELLDIIIHSLVFTEMLGRNHTVAGFLVTSDRRKSVLWQINTRQFVALMRSVARDNPASAFRTRVGNTEEWVEWRGYRRTPPKSFQS